MSDINPAEVRDIRSGRPFRSTVREYYRKGFLPFPLPAKEKHPPPTGVTGRKPSVLVTPEQLDNWVDDKEHEHANIGLKFGRVLVEDREDLPDGEYIVLGIDVDDYVDSEADGKIKTKTGGEQLRELEERLGKLPDTWISSARADGVSGIRFFLAPAGLEWKGKAADSIDVIQPNHRYAVVWPSWHPKGGQYLFTQPGQPPDGTLPTLYGYRAQPLPLRPGQAKGHGTHIKFEQEPTRIPDVHELPGLPEKWIDELTRDRTAEQDVDLDMDISVDELSVWARENFAKGKPCKSTKRTLRYWLDQMENDPSSHDKLLHAHWQLSRMGLLEGHAGAYAAIKKFEREWTENALKSGKRGLSEAKNESFRSITLGWRKIKREIDDAREQGGSFPNRCHCFDEDAPSGGIWDAQRKKSAGVGGDADGADPVGGSRPSGEARDPWQYPRNDDGNGLHLLDLFGEDLKWVPGLGTWIYWDGKRWIEDEDGIARRCWRKVRDRIEKGANQLTRKAEDLVARHGPDNAEAKRALSNARTWREWAEKCGNNVKANGALEAAQSFYGCTVQAEQLDDNMRLLGVQNGVIELRTDGVFFREAKKEDYVLTNTGIPYIPMSEQIQAGGESAEAVKNWNQYLDTFLPDLELRHFVQKVLGYCLLGRNTERLGVFLYGDTSTGKSTMLSAVTDCLGKYASTVEMSIFKDKDLNPGLAQAMPRRIITTTEAGAQNFLHADTFKRMTGNDAMSAELKGVNKIIRRVPSFVPVIATNTAPNIRGSDKALQRRLCILPFNIQVPEDKDRKDMSDILKTSAKPAVLAWLLEGWSFYAKEGLHYSTWPEVVLSATREFAHSLNDIGEFLEECTEIAGDDEWVLASRVYDAFVNWATVVQRIPENSVYTLSAFGKRMREQGFKSEPHWHPESKKSPRQYRGLKLKVESTENSAIKFRGGR